VDEPPFVLPTAVLLPENAAVALGASQPVVWADLSRVAAGSVAQWDPENSTVTFTLAVDGAAGRFHVNSTTGVVTVAPTVNVTNAGVNVSTPVALNFEVLPNVFRLSVTATQRNDSTFLATNSFIVQLTDANDPPLIRRGQALQLSEYADATLPLGVGVNSVLAGSVVATDEDTNVTFNSGAPSFSLVASGCSGVSAASASLAASLFSISAAGAVTLTTNPAADWRLVPAFVSSGQLVRAAYSLCVRAADVAGAFDVQPVSLLIIADLPAQPVITSSPNLAAAQPTTGGSTILFIGVNFRPGGSTPVIAASYTNGPLTFNATNCGDVTATNFTCRTSPGWSSDFVWTVTFDGVAVTATQPLAMSYAPPEVASVSASRTGMPTVGGALVTFVGANFGPAQAMPTVFVGNNGREFLCTVTVSGHSSLTCSMPPGVGAALAWTLAVGAQSLDCPPATCATLFSFAASTSGPPRSSGARTAPRTRL
jgi:hypothetical protein